MAEKIDDASFIGDVHHTFIESDEQISRMVGKAQDDLVGMRPLPVKPEQPRVIPSINRGQYQSIVRSFGRWLG